MAARGFPFLLLAIPGMTGSAAAQTARMPVAPEAPAASATPAGARAPACVEVTVEGNPPGRTRLDCVNARLARSADAAHRPLPVIPADTRTAPALTGIATPAAANQMLRGGLGKTGHIPPAPPVVPPPALGRKP